MEVLGREVMKVGIVILYWKSSYVVRRSLGVYRLVLSLPDARVTWVKLAITSNFLCRRSADIFFENRIGKV